MRLLRLWLISCVLVLVAKSAGLIDVPWWLATWPLWGPVLLWLLELVGMAIGCLLFTLFFGGPDGRQ